MASPAVRDTVQALLQKQRTHMERLMAAQHPNHEARRGGVAAVLRSALQWRLPARSCCPCDAPQWLVYPLVHAAPCSAPLTRHAPRPAPPTLQELRTSLGLLAHNLQLLAAVGIRPDDEDLVPTLRYLRRHQHALTRPQMERLRAAFDAWQLPSTVRKLRELRR